MKLIDLNGVKVLFDILMERIGVEIYTKAEADNKFQPKGKYVEESYLHQLEVGWSDELDKKADDEYVHDEFDKKADKDDVYTKAEIDEKLKNIPKVDTSEFVKMKNGHIVLGDYEIWIEE